MKDLAGVSVSSEYPLCLFRVGGFQRFTLIDFPGRPACIVFTQGCNFRCGYCYNVELVLPEKFVPVIPSEEVFSFLKERRGLLEGVVITGGEPTIQKGLEEFAERVKDMGYAIKLDTNGSQPHVLKRLLERGLVDYVAMDVKAPPYKYQEVCGVEVDVDRILESIELIKASGVDYEFRTTVVKEQLNGEDILKIAELLRGSKRYYLQRFIPGKTLDPSFSQKTTYSDEEFSGIIEGIRAYFQECSFR
ncbi:MAG: anaerobic ribonucleoside-triphosphate reductase activating protein [Aquificota bacterium]|nr:MAG: anaerobic ribonucleoside-triphosphate reductase activating protein [Aquificota bacterium]